MIYFKTTYSEVVVDWPNRIAITKGKTYPIDKNGFWSREDGVQFRVVQNKNNSFRLEVLCFQPIATEFDRSH